MRGYLDAAPGELVPHEPVSADKRVLQGARVPPGDTAPDSGRRPMAMTDLQARRRVARRRRQIARFDVALGAVVAVTLLIVSPGLAITAVVALLVLAVCAVSLGVGRRRRRGARTRGRADERGGRAGGAISRRGRSS
jgi:hypothetical protein